MWSQTPLICINGHRANEIVAFPSPGCNVDANIKAWNLKAVSGYMRTVSNIESSEISGSTAPYQHSMTTSKSIWFQCKWLKHSEAKSISACTYFRMYIFYKLGPDWPLAGWAKVDRRFSRVNFSCLALCLRSTAQRGSDPTWVQRFQETAKSLEYGKWFSCCQTFLDLRYFWRVPRTTF